MALKRDTDDDLRITAAIDELKSMISVRFPAVTFEVGPGYDPDGLYLDAILDTPDFDDYAEELHELVWQRVLDMWGEGLAIFVIAGLTPERIYERWDAIKAGRL